MGYKEMFNEVHASERLKEEVWNMTKQERSRRRWAPALLAAVLALALMGTAVAAGGPDGLREWFSGRWRESAHRPMEAEQAAVIDQLTQEIGVSDTQNGVTVTVDSATVGDSSIWMLLKISGEYPEKEACRYHFEAVDLQLTPDPDLLETPGVCGIDYPYVGVGESGEMTVLLHYSISLPTESSLLDGYQAELVLKDLLYGGQVVQEGQWQMTFMLEPVERAEVLTVEKAMVPCKWDGGTTELRDIQVTSTGIRFVQSGEDQELHPDLYGLVLRDATVVLYSGAASRWLDGEMETAWGTSYEWEVPVDLGEAIALRFGETVIPLR